MRIVILEDNSADVLLLVRALQRSGLEFSYDVATDAQTYEHALEDRPDLILADYALPSFDGMSAFKIKNARWPNIPFIIVSGMIGEENAIELIKSGVTDYALKDKLFVLPEKIRRALEEAAQKARQRKSDELFRAQHKQLLEIAFLQSHQVRRPVATILGLISLVDISKIKDASDREVLEKIKAATSELDAIVREIVAKTEEITVNSNGLKNTFR